MNDLPISSTPSIDSVRIIKHKGPWTTKSGGKLDVLTSIPIDLINNGLLRYDVSELSLLVRDIRGLRLYIVSEIRGIKLAGTNGTEYVAS
jgi:hypothetical protein